jgi:hypothetical protein
LEYKMSRQTVVETPSYIAIAGKLFSDREREDIVAMGQRIRSAAM